MYKTVFGPVPSRRLGVSLGVDLVVPKSCNMNCVFCECGPTKKLELKRASFKELNGVKKEILEVLKSVTPDYITFSGSGEPTLSKDLGELINWIKENTTSKVCVITNSLLLHEDEILKELENADLIIPTLNSVDDLIFKKINRGPKDCSVSEIMEGIKKLCEKFKGEIYIETFIIEGLNDSDEHTDRMSEFLKNLKFTKLQLNSLARDGAEKWVKKASDETLLKIKNRYIENGIKNVEIVGELKERKEKIKINEELVEKMREKREYSQEELKKIYDIK